MRKVMRIFSGSSWNLAAQLLELQGDEDFLAEVVGFTQRFISLVS